MEADSSGGQRARRGQAERSLRPPDNAGPGSSRCLPAREVKHEPLSSLPSSALSNTIVSIVRRWGAKQKSPPGGRSKEPQQPQMPQQCWSRCPSMGGSHTKGTGLGERERAGG